MADVEPEAGMENRPVLFCVQSSDDPDSMVLLVCGSLDEAFREGHEDHHHGCPIFELPRKGRGVYGSGQVVGYVR